MKTKTITAFFVVVTLAGMSAAPAQNAPKGAPPRSSGPKNIPRPVAATAPTQATAAGRPPIDTSGAALLLKIPPFTYIPSERDPFISSTVISPFVTEEDLPEALAPDRELVRKARSSIEGMLEGLIEIRGVSTAERISGYAIGNGGQVLRPGRFLLVPLDTKSVETWKDRLLKNGVTLGVEINDKENSQNPTDLLIKTVATDQGFAYLLETLRIEIQGADGVVVFRSPLEVFGEDRTEIRKKFRSVKGVRQVDDPIKEGDEKNAGPGSLAPTAPATPPTTTPAPAAPAEPTNGATTPPAQPQPETQTQPTPPAPKK